MGTNYYAVIEEGKEVDCPHCGRPGHIETVRWHIGKSSHGWCFALHVGSRAEPHIPATLDEWRKVWASCIRIEDEYGRGVTTTEIEQIVTDRQGQGWPFFDAEKERQWYVENCAQPGPRGLARHVPWIDGGCIGHGAETYDLIIGEFS